VPNEFLHPSVIAAAALGVLEREVVLPQFITRLAEADFRGAKDDTVTMRVPAYLEAREYEWRNNRAQPIEIDDIVETGVDVKLDTMPYSAVGLTDEQLTLDIVSFGEQVLAPQSRAMVRHMEQIVASTIEGASIAWTVDEADPYLAAAKARAALNKASVPVDGRALLLGADVETAFLSSPLLVRADTSGSASALRDAQIGRIAGMDTYVSMFIDPDTAYALHASAFALANMAPVVPDGATYGQSQTYASYAVRWIRDYDAMFLRDRSVLSSFIGCSSVNDGRQLGEEHEDENVRVVKITGIGAAA
jgi:P22 coat protein - gene protein 5